MAKKAKNLAEDGEKKSRFRLWDKGEDNKIRNYFLRVFGKYDFRDEAQFSAFTRWLLYTLLILVEVMMLWEHSGYWKTESGKLSMVFLTSFQGVLTVSEGVKLFAVKRGKRTIPLIILNVIAACGILFFAEGTYTTIIFVLILSELYISVEKARTALLIFCLSMPLYATCYALKRITWVEMEFVMIFQESLGAVLALSVHYIAAQIALAFYRQYLRLNKALRALDESKQELEKAYAVVAEVTALEERQRIAKEIHDTAGHSLTTVIMQTEAARRIIDENVEDAKTKIIAANLRAKHALEELRDSVHLLSGNPAKLTLKMALEEIIHESTDGTGIVIRSSIEDTRVSDSKHRFLCNTLKEGISNGLRHGGATAFWFELRTCDEKIEFLLSDNGKGGALDLKMGFGLTTMRDRAKAFGGEMSFVSEEGEGFDLCLSLPMDKEE